MNWKDIYRKYSNFSGKELVVGIKDWEQRLKILFNWIKKLPRDSQILDCRCGIGIAGIALQEKGFKNIIGIDIDKKNVSIAKRFYRVYRTDLEKIEFKSKMFDVILALNVIEHLNQPEKFISNIKKILKNNDYLILSLPNEIWFRKILGLVPKDPTHKQSWSCFSFRKFLIINGFEVFDIKPVGRIPFYFASQTFMILARLRK
jgi:2-polyprenyl-3-methyl-5-hydroxy-6-metoxy-1,4-benzoquinol methylase